MDIYETLKRLLPKTPGLLLFEDLAEDTLQEAALAYLEYTGSLDETEVKLKDQLLAVCEGDPAVEAALSGPEADRLVHALAEARRFCWRVDRQRKRHPTISLDSVGVVQEEARIASAALRTPSRRRLPNEALARFVDPIPYIDAQVDREWRACGHPPFRVADGASHPSPNPDYAPDPGPALLGEIAFEPFHTPEARATCPLCGGHLTPRQYAAVVLVWRGYLQREVAERLGISQQAVSRLLQRARQRLIATD